LTIDRENTMSTPMTAGEVLDREFLEIRAKILEVAAALDRLQRAEGSVADDPRLGRLRDGVQLLLEHPADRAEQVQLLFSRPYEDDWRETFELPRPS
jgi:hypothetical protein